MGVQFLNGINLNSTKLQGLANGSASTDAVNKGQLDSAIAALAAGLEYKGTLDASTLGTQLDDASKGDFYKVSVAGTILTTIELAVGDMIIVNKDVTGTPVAADIDKIDNTDQHSSFKDNIGDGSTTSIAVTHNLGTKDVNVIMRRNSDDANIVPDWVATSTSVVTIDFATAPATDAYRVIVNAL